MRPRLGPLSTELLRVGTVSPGVTGRAGLSRVCSWTGVGYIQPRVDGWSHALGLGDGTQEGTGLGLLKIELRMGTTCCLEGTKGGMNSRTVATGEAS